MNLPNDWLVSNKEIPSDEYVIYHKRTWRFLYTLKRQLSYKTKMEATLALSGGVLSGMGFLQRVDWKISTYEQFLSIEPRVPTTDLMDPKRQAYIRASHKDTRFDPAVEDFHRTRMS